MNLDVNQAFLSPKQSICLRLKYQMITYFEQTSQEIIRKIVRNDKPII